jgi:hypothetical protein
VQNPNDAIRLKLLQFFHNRNVNATSRMGKRGSAIRISDLKSELKALHGFTQQQVVGNLNYLLDNGWVKELSIDKTVIVKGGTIPSTTKFYEITAKGIDEIEGGSRFRPRDRYAGINIIATGSNVITLGDGNIVNARYEGLHTALEELRKAVLDSTELGDTEKLDITADIETAKDQLAKREPNRGVLRALWSGLGKLATLETVARACERVRPLIGPLVGP